MGVKMTFGAEAKKSIDPAKALMQAIFPPKGMPIVSSENWYQWVKHWTVDEAWWVPYVAEEANQTVSVMFWEFQKSKATEFALWVTQELPNTVKDGAFGNTPVQVLSVDQNGHDSMIIMRVGPYTLEIVNWVANQVKKPSKKPKHIIGDDEVLVAAGPMEMVDHKGNVVQDEGELHYGSSNADYGPGSAAHMKAEEDWQAKDGPFAPQGEQFGTDEDGDPTIILGGD
jgi:hypothetical protein